MDKMNAAKPLETDAQPECNCPEVCTHDHENE